ncbi:hypothetical protein LX99_03098 [Mucilaginibacter oryzae]|uniref:Uncharacterized protein n=1 Tax=Mucilaginibacter oryzae TaxID=468058 RepID=A0A316HA23_9SPHI|nr:hypothetical protein LX99_03098 [Mucilaginibacter oryzae]
MEQNMMLLSTKVIDVRVSDKPVLVKKVPLMNYRGELLAKPFYKPISKILKGKTNEV